MYLSKALCFIYACEWVEMFTQPESLVAHLSVIQFLWNSNIFMRLKQLKFFIKAEEAVYKKELTTPYVCLETYVLMEVSLLWRSKESWKGCPGIYSGGEV